MNQFGDPYFDTHCDVTNTDTGHTVTGEVHNFKSEKFLSIVLNRSVEIKLTYNPRSKVYFGSKGGMEFTSPGPVEHIPHDATRR